MDKIDAITIVYNMWESGKTSGVGMTADPALQQIGKILQHNQTAGNRTGR